MDNLDKPKTASKSDSGSPITFVIDFYNIKGEWVDGFFSHDDEETWYDIMPDFHRLRIRGYKEILREELQEGEDVPHN
jgi:hypothetical protein